MLPPNVNTTQICFMQGIVIVTLDQGPINQGYMAREPGCSSKLGRSHSCCSLSKFHPLIFWLWGLVVVWGCLRLMVFICKFKHGYRRSTIVKLHAFEWYEHFFIARVVKRLFGVGWLRDPH